MASWTIPRRWRRPLASVVLAVAVILGCQWTFAGSLTASLISNPSCATSTTGWGGVHASISRTNLDGGFACQVTQSQASSFFELDDFPGTTVTTGTTYTAVASVATKASVSVGKPIALVIRETYGGTMVGTSSSATVSLSTAFQTLTVTRNVRSGDTLAIYIVQRNATNQGVFYARGLSLSSGAAPTSTPTPSTTATPSPTATASSTPKPSATPTPAPTATPTPKPTASPTPLQTPTPTPSSNPVPLGVPGNWTLKFDDEFNGTSLDKSRWVAENGYKNNNITTSPEDCSVSGGHAILTLPGNGTGCQLSSAAIDGAGSNAYSLPVGGYVEYHAFFPGRSSTTCYNWSAVWASGPNWPQSGEIDVAEVLGGNLTVNYHYPGGAKNTGAPSGGYCNAWHTFGVYRTATADKVYWDGVLVRTIATSDNGQGEGIILTCGNGGVTQYGSAGALLVDYVRAWQ